MKLEWDTFKGSLHEDVQP
jgi:hypothetical protein